MFGWFKKKKTETKVKVVHNQYADQRGARAKGDIVGGNKYSTYSSDPVVMYPAVDPVWDLTNPTNPLSPLNPINSTYDEPSSSKGSSHDSSSSWSSSDFSSSSSSSWSSSDSSSSYSSSDSGSSYSDSSSY